MENNVIVNDLKELICEKNDPEHYYKIFLEIEIALKHLLHKNLSSINGIIM